MTTASIMFVTYNRLYYTEKMMASFLRTTTTPYHLAIVDNGSTDGTIEWLKKLTIDSPYCQDLQIHFNEKNLGLSTGRNQGLKLTSKFQDPWIATIDNDIEMPNNWIQQCIDIMTANPNYSIGVNFEGVSYPIITKNGKTFQHKPNGNLGGACTVFSRELHNKIGYYPTHMAPYGEDDASTGIRSRIAGYQLGYLTEPGVHWDEPIGEYREFKDACRKSNLEQFFQDYRDYMQGKKPIYIPYSEKIVD